MSGETVQRHRTDTRRKRGKGWQMSATKNDEAMSWRANGMDHSLGIVKMQAIPLFARPSYDYDEAGEVTPEFAVYHTTRHVGGKFNSYVELVSHKTWESAMQSLHYTYLHLGGMYDQAM